MNYLNLSTIRMCTESEGPGRRFAIWCQGCLKKCAGCCNVDMQPFVKNKIVSVKDLEELILQAKRGYQIEGISLLGGEPLLQAEGLAELTNWCQDNEISVVLFTGYTYEEILKTSNVYVHTILKGADIVVDGPFIQELYDTERDWVGSTNQNVIFLTSRYVKGIEYEKQLRSMEFLVSEKEILMNGWPFGTDTV